MALFSQNMIELSMELAAADPCYDEMAFKFFEHFCFISKAINHPGHDGMWDEEDGFYYDVLVFPDGRSTRLKVRSMVGLLPLCATTVIEKYQTGGIQNTMAAIDIRKRQMPGLFESIHPTGPGHLGIAGRGIFALVTPERLRRILSKCWMRMNFSAPMESVPSRSSTGNILMYSMSANRNTVYPTCRPNRIPGCLAVIPTGEGRSGYPSTSCSSEACSSSISTMGIPSKLNVQPVQAA
jgi:hypothetical protein